MSNMYLVDDVVKVSCPDEGRDTIIAVFEWCCMEGVWCIDFMDLLVTEGDLVSILALFREFKANSFHS